MSIIHNQIFYKLAKTIELALQNKYPELKLSLEDISKNIGEPPNLEMGHYAFACFPLAKILKCAPPLVAKTLAEEIKPDSFIRETKAVGPYLNFFISSESLGEIVVETALEGTFFKQKLIPESKKVMIEYSQPNTHKILHVGHMRNLCLGNALVRLFRYCGHNVVATTYPGDVGTHVAKTLWYLKYHNQEPTPEENKGEWLGIAYSKAHCLLEDQIGTPLEAINRIQLTEILKQLETKQGEFFNQWKETRNWSLELFKFAYNWADVSFDKWFFESEVDSTSLERAKKYLAEGKYIVSEGAVGMDLSEDKLGFCMMIKSDGNGMYATKDIELAYRKFEEDHIDRNIYIVDKRQELHFKQVFKVLEKLGFPRAKDCHHLSYDFVELPDGAMSSRKGNIVPLTELISKMENTIKKDYLERYRGIWDDKEINETASMVANGAIKFGMIKMDNSRKIVFDMAEWLKLEGETGPYLQYVYARIHSLCEKLGYKGETKADWSLLKMPPEKALLIKLSHFNNVVIANMEQMRVSGLCAYLFDLGKLFNNFYVECPIGKADSEELKKARLLLAKSVGVTIEKGLAILGIPAPKRM